MELLRFLLNLCSVRWGGKVGIVVVVVEVEVEVLVVWEGKEEVVGGV